MFFFLKSILLVITNPLFMIIWLCPPSHSLQENWNDHKKFWRFQIPLPLRVSYRCCKHGGGGLSQNMGGAWGELKMLPKIPVKEFIW